MAGCGADVSFEDGDDFGEELVPRPVRHLVLVCLIVTVLATTQR